MTKKRDVPEWLAKIRESKEYGEWPANMYDPLEFAWKTEDYFQMERDEGGDGLCNACLEDRWSLVS